MSTRFYVIGVGPGDPELLTMKAARILKHCPVWFAPKARKEGESTALSIIEQVVDADGKDILTHHFPMKKIHMGQAPEPEVARAWRQAADAIALKIRQGQDVAFPTLGDPAIYSTGFYVLETLGEIAPDVDIEIIPGVSSLGASSAAAVKPLCLGDDRMVVIPATFENGRLRETLEQYDTVVLMKVHRVMDRLLGLLEEMDLIDRAVLVERSSLKEQHITRDLRDFAPRQPHYFSTMIVRK